MMHQVMFQCGFFLIGGIVAAGAGAGVVSVPALFRTGGGFCFVLHQIMFQRGDCSISGIAATAAGAAFVSIPAGFRTGGGFCCALLQSMIICVSFAVFPTTHLTDRFGAAGCCATGTVCSINFRAVLAAAGVRVRGAVVDRRPRAPVVTAVVTPSASGALSLRDAGRVAVAAAVFGLTAVAAIADFEVHIHVANGLPLAPVVTENAVFRAAFFTDFSCDAGRGLGAAGMCQYIYNIAILVAERAFVHKNLMIGRIIFFVSEDLTFILSPTVEAEQIDPFWRRFNV